MKRFTSDKDLARLLILTPYRPSISDPTIALLDNLTRSGATTLKLPGMSDVGLARCLLAAAACEFIGKTDKDIEVVMWLDADMFAERDVLIRQLNHLVEVDAEFQDSLGAFPVAVSGMYARRREANVLTASRVEDHPVHKLEDGTLLVPAHTGLGCLMQPVMSFIDGCERAEQLVTERGQTIPAICRTGPRTTRFKGQDVRCWGQEDWWYCERIWQLGGLVYLDTSVAWGHLSESLTLPMGMPQNLFIDSDRIRSDGGSEALTP